MQGINKQEMNKLPAYSVLMAVYQKDNPEWFETALESMAVQSWPPDEILIIEDGPVPQAIRDTERICRERHPEMIRVIAREQNCGLAGALRAGVPECRNEWIARMDADDYSAPERCEKQLKLAQEKHADIVGCDCAEFMDNIDHITARRVFPEEHEELIIFSRRKSPFCHPGVMMKKERIIEAGNYRDYDLMEDYELFIRMLENGCIGCTKKEFLIFQRVNDEFYKRRSGGKYVKDLFRFNLEMYRKGWTKLPDLLVRSAGNIVTAMSPESVRKWIYGNLLRK